MAILTPFVGERDADETDMENETLMQQVAVYWLAEHGILYIDIRPASIRIGNDAVTAYLIDYDDCVLLKQPLHTAAAVLENLRCNAHAAKWISLYPVLVARIQSMDQAADVDVITKSLTQNTI